MLESVAVAESTISGRGLFATSTLAEGDLVIRLGGRLVSDQDLEQLLDTSPEYVDTLTVYEGRHLVLPSGTPIHYGNHSCDPNLWHVGPYQIVARRQIEGGEELTIDYGTQSGAPGFSMVCTCEAVGCRAQITSEDWRLPALQSRYEGHWTPALAELIRRHRP